MTISNYLLSPQTSDIQIFFSLSPDTFASYFTEKIKAKSRELTQLPHSPFFPLERKQCLHSDLSEPPLGLLP